MLIIGCDPGLTGAIALLCKRRGVLACVDLPTEQNGQATGKMRRWTDCAAVEGILADWSVGFCFAHESVHAVIEWPIAMPTLPAQTTASQFDTFGVMRALLIHRVGKNGLTTVTPREWKKALKLSTDKNESIAKAREIYPAAAQYLGRKKDHNRAEAILLAHWLMLEMVGGVCPP